MQPQGLVVVAVVVVRISITLTEPRRAAVAVGSVFWVLVPAVLLEPMPGSGAPEDIPRTTFGSRGCLIRRI